MARVVLHCDLNSFYASVELLSHPELQNFPVAVCGDPAARHGIILAKNEQAKHHGIRTAETVWQAKKKCPDLILLPPHHELYAQYSRRVNAIYAEYTDLVEPFGIDESWLDVTNTLHLFRCDAVTLADTIRARIKRELGLTLSVGVSFNKVFAKLGSDYKKPDATTLISEENWRGIVRPLPVGDLLFVGHAAREILAKYGIETIGALGDAPAELLETLLGKLGAQLHRYANGLDDDPVRGPRDHEPIKSVGNGSTFKRDLTTPDEVRSAVALLADSVAMRLRRHGLYCSGVQVLFRNNQFKNTSRQKQLSHPTHLMREITEAAAELVKSAWHAPEPIRMITVTAINLSPAGATYDQMDLLGGGQARQEKQENVERAMDRIREKYGRGAISYAAPSKTALQGEDEE